MSSCQPVCGEVFNLKDLIPQLLSFCSSGIKGLGCLTPNDCGEDVLTDYLYSKKVKEFGLIEMDEETIRINFPNTDRQLPVLKTMLKFRLRGKHHRCEACIYRSVTSPVTDFIPDPSDPEKTYQAKEMVDRARNTIRHPLQRKAFERAVLDGFSHEKIAKELNRKPETIRKWFSRNRERIARSLDATIFRSKDK